MTFTRNSPTIIVELPTRLYTDLQVLATQERIDIVELLTRLVSFARQDSATFRNVVAFRNAAPLSKDIPSPNDVLSSQPDPVFELIGAYQSQKPLIDNIPVSEDPDLYLVLDALGEQNTTDLHAWEIAPARYKRGADDAAVCNDSSDDDEIYVCPKNSS